MDTIAAKTLSPVYLWVILLTVLALIGIYVGCGWAGMGVTASVDREAVGGAFTKLEAYNQYVQGKNNWGKRDERSIRRAITFFRRAIQLDANMAPAYSGLADCYTALGYGSYELPGRVFLPADTAARRALQMDSTLPDAHASLGYIRLYYNWDWAGAEKEFTRAIQLDPHSEWTFDSYAYFLTARERFPEAAVAIKRALLLNPLSAQINTDEGFCLYYSGRDLQALRPLQAALTINPRNPLAHLWLGRSYQQLKEYDRAIAEYQLCLGLNRNWPPALAALGHVYGESGQRVKARTILDSLIAMQQDRFVTAYGIALVYSALNERDKALEWLEKAYAERSNWLVWLKLDPRWDAIRRDPRFASLVSRVGINN